MEEYGEDMEPLPKASKSSKERPHSGNEDSGTP